MNLPSLQPSQAPLPVEGELELRSALDATPVLLAYLGRDGFFRWVNGAFARWFGVPRRALEGMHARDVFGAHTFTQIDPFVVRALAGQPVTFEMALPSRESGKRWLSVSLTPLEGERRTAGYLITAADITALRMEVERSEFHKLLQIVFESGNQGVAFFDEELRLVRWNPAFTELQLVRPESLMHGYDLSEALRWVAEEGGFGEGDAVELAAEALQAFRSSNGAPGPIRTPLGRVLQVQRFFLPNGGLAAAFTDITDRARAEEYLEHAQRLKSLGELTGGIAHDFNNLLSVISGNLDLLEECILDPRDRELITMARKAAMRGAELSGRLLAFGRRQTLKPETLSVDDLVGTLTGLLSRTLGENIRVETDLAPDLPQIHADRGQLENALLNLAINARDAMPEGGRLQIGASVREVQSKEPLSLGGMPGPAVGTYVVLSVGDTGRGMSPAHAARAFEPFFTTKDVGHGTGLGLSMVYGFIQQSRGHVDLASSEGVGTTVSLFLPALAAAGAGDTAGSVPRSRILAGGGERVLLVEDQAAVRETVRRMLERLEYQVVESQNAADALEVLSATPQTVDLVLTDVRMPGGMSGIQLAQSARARWPALPVIVVSGYPEEAVPEWLPFLSKPFAFAGLAEALALALASARVRAS